MKTKQGSAEVKAAGHTNEGSNKKFWHRAIAIGAAVVALGVGAGIFVPKFFEEATPNVVEEGFVTVSEPAPTDGSTPDMHSALENIAYMNAVFKGQTSWYSEMHGTTDASLMKQSVSTYKQYSEGVLIVADITESAMVKAARQFCYAGDEVLWRLGSSYDASTYDEMMSAEWESGEPYAHMYLEDFIAQNGLPATEFSVYIINEETLLSADEVVKNADGSYSQTYYLDPAADKAPAHYANQMVFSGGLTALPEFTSIKVTYTFDENWQVLSSTVEEAYKATMGISVNCSSVFTTVYEYGTVKSESPAYEDYFKQYLGGEVTGPVENVPTAVGCLGEAFGSVLQGPTIFDLSLDLNGTPLEGAVLLDVGDMTLSGISLSADFGSFQIWLDGGELYLRMGGIRGKLALEDVLGALNGGTAAAEGDESGLDLDALLAQLGEGEFTYDESSASLSAELTLGGITLPVDFAFALEDGHASLENVSTHIAAEGIEADVVLSYGEKAPSELSESDKAAYPDLMPHIETLASILTGEALRADISYAGEGFAVNGGLDISLSNGTLAGDFALTLNGVEKAISFAYADGYVLLDVDGIKIKVNAEEALAFIGQFLELPEMEVPELSLDVETLLNNILSGDLGTLISMSENDNVLSVLVKGNELLQMLGLELGLDLGDVSLSVSEGQLTASALGANIALTEGKTPVINAEEYIDILPYTNALISLFKSEALHADISYAGDGFAVNGGLDISLSNGTLAGELTLTLNGVEKALTFAYADGYVLLDVDGIKLKANAEEALAFIGQFLELPEMEVPELSLDLNALLQNILSGDLGTLISMTESDNVLSVLVKGNELLQLLGLELDLDLGDVSLSVSEGQLSATALGANITLTEGKSPVINADEYINILPYVNSLTALFSNEALHADISYAGDGFAVNGGLDISLSNGTLAGDLTLTLNDTEKSISFAYADGYVLLDLDGIKLKADAEEAISFIGQFLELPEVEVPELSFDVEKLLNNILSGDLGTLISMTESDNVLSVLVKGNELLELLGLDLGLDLGEVNLFVSEGQLTASALGANIAFTQGKVPVINAEEYIDILPYAETLADIFSTGYFDADIDLSIGGLSILGNVSFGLDPFVVRAQLYIAQDMEGKYVEVEYEGEDLFVTIDGVTLRASAQELLPLLSDFLPLEGTEIAGGIGLKNLLALDFSTVISGLLEENGVLSLRVNGDALLRALGIDFSAGYLDLAVGKDALSLSCEALNIDLTLKKGSKFLIDHDRECVDVQPLIEKVLRMIEEQAVSFSGSISVEADGLSLPVEIQRGMLSWKDGFSLVLEGELALGQGRHHFYLSADTAALRIAYGDLGLVLPYDEFPELLETLNGVLEKISLLLEKVGITLPDLSTLSGVEGGLGDLTSLDLGALLSGIVFEEVPGGLFGVKAGDFSLRLAEEQDGIAKADVVYSAESLTIGASVSLDWFETSVKMPNITYLTVDDLKDIAEYLTAAENTVKNNSVTLTLSPIETEAGSISVTAQLYHGENFPIQIDTQDKTITVSADTYLHLNVEVDASEGQLPLYVEAWVLDADKNGELDFYVTASRMKAGETGYHPLVVTATAGELMPLIASALPLLGIDVGFINDYFISHLLDEGTAERLAVIGDSLLDTLDFFGVFEQLFGGAGGGSDELIAGLSKGEDTFSVTLGGGALGLGSDLKLTLGKMKDENGDPFLQAVSLGIGGTDIAFELGYDVITPAVPTLPAGQSYALDGMAELFTALAKTATRAPTQEELISGQQQADDILLSRTFFIDGGAQVHLTALSFINVDFAVNIEGLSVSIHEDGDISLNVRLSYNALKALSLVSVIEGGCTVDLTLRGDMIYMRRVQETDANGKALAAPETVYRAMPLSVFGETLVEQLGFVLNLSSSILDAFAGTEPSEEETVQEDLGTQAWNILKSFAFAENEGGDTWTLVFNGAALTGDILGDITVTLGSDEKGCIKALGVEAGIDGSGLYSVSLEADLALENGGGEWAEGKSDITEDMEGVLTSRMGEALAEMQANGWKDEAGNAAYLEGKSRTLTYYAAGNELKEQEIMVDASGAPMGEVEYPELDESLQLPGYTLQWPENIPEDGQIHAQYVPNVYKLTFESDRPAEGWTEADGKWQLALDYTYNETFSLPFASDERMKLVGFTDEVGNFYAASEDLARVLSDRTLTAVWEDIDYTVTYMDGERVLGTQTAHYGDELLYPEAEKAGYRFVGWDRSGTVTGDMTVNAVFEALTFRVTLESEFPLDGFEETDGVWKKAIDFTYDSTVDLPNGVRYEGRILRGFKAGDVTAAETLPNVLEDTVFTAVWESIGYDVTFMADGEVVAVRNLHYGESISPADLPAIPEKTGYTAVWAGAENGYTHNTDGDFTIQAVYTPETYTVTLVSSLPYDGFVENGGRYERTVLYTYGTEAIALETLSDIPGYWFKGFYTGENGTGEQVTEIDVLGDTAYYVYWQDNTVTVRLYSDLAFAGAQKDAEGYYVERSFNDAYALEQLPEQAGYKQLGWWAETEGGYTPVDDVLAFYGQNNVHIWAVWMQEIEIEITEFSVNVTNIFVSKVVTYNILGTSSGGTIFGAKGKNIFSAEPTKQVQYVVYRDGERDILSGGDSEFIEGGEFGKRSMMCGNSGATFLTAPYGGALVTHTFRYLDADGVERTISTSDEATISLESFTLVFYDEGGNELERMTVHGSYGTPLTLGDLSLPAVPEKPGYSGSWTLGESDVIDSGSRKNAATSGLDLVLSHTLDVKPVYTPRGCLVTLTAQDDVKIDGWVGETYETELKFGQTIEFTLSGSVLETYTVGLKNDVTLPKLPEGAFWSAIEETGNGIRIVAVKNPDKVTLYDGFDGNVPYEFDSDYTLPVYEARDGYTFLGWWGRSGESWQKVEALSYSGGGAKYELYALWVKAGTVSGSYSGKTFTITAGAPEFKCDIAELKPTAYTCSVSYSVKYGGLWGIGEKTDSNTVVVNGTWNKSYGKNINSCSITAKTLVYTVGGVEYRLSF